MKKLMFTIAVATFAMVSCGSSKAVATPAPAPVQQAQPDEIDDEIARMEKELKLAELQEKKDEIAARKALRDIQISKDLDAAKFRDIPCLEDTYDTDDYYAGLGIGMDKNETSARLLALQNAQQYIKNKLGGAVKGVAVDYSNNYRGSAPTSSAQSKIENMFETVIDKMLNDAEDVCAKMKVDEGDWRQGNSAPKQYTFYTVIHIDKKQFIEEMDNALSNDEKLDIDFRSSEFRKQFEKTLNAYKEEKNAAAAAALEAAGK